MTSPERQRRVVLRRWRSGLVRVDTPQATTPDPRIHHMDKVLIAPMTLAGLDGAFVQVLREAGFELVYPNLGWQLNEDELLSFLPGIKASLAGSEPYTARVLAAHPTLRVIARAGVGFDAVAVSAAT